MIRLALALSLLAPALAAQGQVKFRRPYSEGYRLGYGFDNNGGSSGCQDYGCGSACYDGHTGEDFALPRGTTVRAGQSGTVTATNDGCANTGYVGNTCGGRCGNYVQLRHSDGSRTIYCHMERGSLQVRTGQSVSCGQAIGRSASSGSSSGPHLHFGYRSPGGSSQEVFAGSCGRGSSLWVNQHGYLEAPGTACSSCTPSSETCDGRDQDCDGRVDEGVTRSCSTACGSGRQSCSGGSWGGCSAPAPSPESCNGEDDDCDGTVDDEDVCEIRLLHRQPAAYAPPRFTDVDGDGRADVCGRGYSGVRCWPAVDGGWGDAIAASGWGDDNGWDDVTNFATIRMGDLDGDGRADLCARANAGMVCRLSRGDSFEGAGTWHEGLRDDSGWAQPDNYTTIRLADVNGDGRDDLCARANAGMRCWLNDGSAFATRIDGPVWNDADEGFDRARHYGTIRTADVNGDRRADLCARTRDGFECWLSDGAGFPTRVEGPRWSNDSGWGAMRFWSTIRMADIDGDGRADVCARSARDLRCHRSLGESFEAEPIVMEAAFADVNGWDEESTYATVRVGDVDGDGRDDLCLRAHAGIRCLLMREAGPLFVDGPGWSDESGWSAPRHYQTFRLADWNGDGLDDICARAGVGWICHPSMGESFGEAVELGDMSNDGGWGALRYWSTIQSAGRACRPDAETCNGVDDDCDGAIDEWVCERGDAGPGAGSDGSVGPPVEIDGGCGCRVARGPSSAPGAFSLLALLGMLVGRRRRRRAQLRSRS